MSLINIILLSSTFGIIVCLNPFRQRPQHVVYRKQQARKREKMMAEQKYSKV